MEAQTTGPARPVRINRWLPYWAVFQSDVRQTLRSWVFRTWVFMSILAAVGYLLYRLGAYREAGIMQPASMLISDLLRWTVIGSVTLIVVLTVGSIASERGTMADSVLSRGISRYQYFMGKWHARLAAVLATFFVMGVLWLAASFFLLHDDLSLDGALMAMLTMAALLMAVITCGVTVSAMASSTVLGIAVLWMALYGLSLLFSLLPDRFVSLERMLQRLPYVLRGYYDMASLMSLVMWSSLVSLVAAAVGLFHFSRCDV
jgi:ABC-2 type transport system permease protein